MTEKYKLPVSSYEELIKIIKAYGKQKPGNAVSLDDLNKSSGMGRTVISKNNGFLMQTGLVSKGNKKTPTEMCQKLAQAYNMNLNEKVESIWKDILAQDDFINDMISVVSIKGKMSKTEYISHMIYSAGCSNGAGYRAGAVAVIEILKLIKAVSEFEGNITPGNNENINMVSKADSSTADAEAMVKNENVVQTETSYYIQQYTCESGAIAKIIIPQNATEDDLLGFRDMLEIVLKRKFKIAE